LARKYLNNTSIRKIIAAMEDGNLHEDLRDDEEEYHFYHFFKESIVE